MIMKEDYLLKEFFDFSRWQYAIDKGVGKDIDELNKFVMDCLRAVKTGKGKVGGLGYARTQKDGCISRGLGRNVKANRAKLPTIEGYHTIGCMQNALRTRREAYNALISQM